MRELVEAFFKTGSGSAISIILTVISTKIIAIVLGPSGIGLLSLLRQIVATSAVTGTAGQTAILQGIVSKEGGERDRYLVTVFWLYILVTVLTCLILIFFASEIANLVLNNSDRQSVNLIRYSAVPVALTMISAYLYSLLNGFKAIGKLALGQILGSLALALLALPISKIIENGYYAAFILMMSISLSAGLLYYLTVAYHEGWLDPIISYFRPQLYRNAIEHFYKIAITTLITGLSSTVVLLIIRAMIVQKGGLDYAGLFDVAWTLSMTYVMIFLGSLGTYYAPRLGEMRDQQSRIDLIQDAIRLAILVSVPMVVSVIVFKPLVIEILYSNQFMPALETIRWMLIGDYIKVSCWVIAIPAVMRAHMRVFFLGEIAWQIGFLIISAIAVSLLNNMQGIGVGFIIMYAIYFIYYLYYNLMEKNIRFTQSIVSLWALGLLIILMASWNNWNSIHVNWISAPVWLGASISFAWMALSRNERRQLICIARSRI
jgi:O-antigen/teichoic acid export membrane protein